jgi:4-nitrophenyl phosphatase
MPDPKLYILDLDGTVYRGSEAIEGAAETVRTLLDRGRLVRYLTNNSAARPKGITEKLNLMGIPCEPSWVYGSGMAAVRWCRNEGLTRVMVVGEPGLHESAAEAGLVQSENPDAVVVGICRSFSYDLMKRAMQAIQSGAKFVATNLDPTYPLENGVFEPGAGSIVAAIQRCSGVEPKVIGKPEPESVLQIVSDAGVKPEETLVVGDRHDTDIESGRRAGCPTWMVLTGVTTELAPDQPGSFDLLGLID